MTGRLQQAGEILTVGFPFCAFKLLMGLALVRGEVALGVVLLALGALDVGINVVNLVSLAAGRDLPMGVCTAQIVARRVHAAWSDVGAAIDVVLSFVLVAVSITFDVLSPLPAWGRRAWGVAVVLNVLGAGFGRLTSSLASLKRR